MHDDPSNYKYIPNPAYDPDLPWPDELPDGLTLCHIPVIVDPTVGLALAYGKINLEYLRDNGGSLSECLRLLATGRSDAFFPVSGIPSWPAC